MLLAVFNQTRLSSNTASKIKKNYIVSVYIVDGPGEDNIGEGRSQQQLSVNWSHMLNIRSKNVVLTKYTYKFINKCIRHIMLLLENIAYIFYLHI